MQTTMSTEPVTPAKRKRTSTSAFARDRDARRGALTHDQITEDVEAFTSAGGKIEVLGNTRMLKTIGVTAEAERAETEGASAKRNPAQGTAATAQTARPSPDELEDD